MKSPVVGEPLQPLRTPSSSRDPLESLEKRGVLALLARLGPLELEQLDLPVPLDRLYSYLMKLLMEIPGHPGHRARRGLVDPQVPKAPPVRRDQPSTSRPRMALMVNGVLQGEMALQEWLAQMAPKEPQALLFFSRRKTGLMESGVLLAPQARQVRSGVSPLPSPGTTPPGRSPSRRGSLDFREVD